MNVLTLYIQHIDELRRSVKINTSTFCEGICSDRQFRRYLSGDNLPTQDKIQLFLDKLNITPNEFYNSFYKKDIKELSKLYTAYNYILREEFKMADDVLNILRKRKVLTIHSSRFLQLCQILLDHRTDRITDMNAVDKFKKLIGYPEVMEKDMFTFIDIACINQIALIMSDYNDFSYIDEMYKKILKTNLTYLSSSERYILPAIYLSVARSYGVKRDLIKCLEVSKEGIEYSWNITDFGQLSSLYYLASYCEFNLGNKNTAYDYAKKCISLCVAVDDTKNLQLFKRLFLKEQMLSFDNIETANKKQDM